MRLISSGWIRVSAFMIFMLFSQWLMALEGDSEQPITIDSNSATYDDKQGTSIYIGNVVAIQGSMRMEADKLVVFFVAGAIDKLVATGNPVHLKQLPQVGKEEIKGKSLVAEYFPAKKLFVLTQKAEVWQGQNLSSSEIILYDIKNSLIKAGETASATKRVHATFQPNDKKAK
ncbi:MAG: lipopolysaccharide transport periplasmic protein LptA [Methylococcaceae bacterium]|nr:lipopolysaccharide transport periplasmic protein LptA [Methylococcaceae bacterium]